MKESNISKDLYQKAEKRVKIKREFKEHRNVFISVILGLSLFDIFTGSGIDFAHYVFAAWGIGVLCHWSDCVNRLKKLDGDKDVQRELEMMLKKQLGDEYKGQPFEINMNTSDDKEIVKKD